MKLSLHPDKRNVLNTAEIMLSMVKLENTKKKKKIEEKASLGCWEPNPGALQEQQVFSMTWVSLLSTVLIFLLLDLVQNVWFDVLRL